VRVVAAWCELRRDFRHFRTDRVVDADFIDERYPARREMLRAEWRKLGAARAARMRAEAEGAGS
jgi:predicted DNA-binding transcriptional regulator YafY